MDQIMNAINSLNKELKQIDDGALVIMAQAGNVKALNTLLQRYEGYLFNLVNRVIKNRTNSLDAVQEILMKAVVGLQTFQQKSSFKTWIYRIALNHTFDLRAKEKRSPTLDPGINSVEIEANEELISSTNHHEVEGEKETVTSLLTGLLLHLDDQHRKAFILRDLLNLPNQHASAMLNITTDNFRQQVCRARKELKNWMSEKPTLIKNKRQSTPYDEDQLALVKHFVETHIR
jgi:RNA polymerase sigma factor (sigma-70 family)